MTEMTDEELIAFLKANKDRVKGFIISELPDLMESAKKETESGFDDVKEKTETIMGEVKDFIKEEKEAYKDDDLGLKKSLKEIVGALTDKEVQKHFVRMGMEFAMGLSALVDAMPKPEFVEKTMDKASDFKKTASREYCANNEDCPRRTVKKIELD